MELLLTYSNSREIAFADSSVDKIDNVETQSFGRAWSSNLHRNLVLGPAVNGINSAHGQRFSISAIRGDSSIVSFARQIPYAGYVVLSPGNLDRLVELPDGYRYISESGGILETYDTKGKLLRIDHRSGQSLRMQYSELSTLPTDAPGPGYLTRVTDSIGRALQFSYALQSASAGAQVGQVSTIKFIVDDQAWFTHTANYENGMLSKLLWPDGVPRTFAYDRIGKITVLSGLIDELGQRFSEYAYDTFGRAVSTKLAGGANFFAIQYLTQPIKASTDLYDRNKNIVFRTVSWEQSGRALVSGPNGAQTEISGAIMAGFPMVTSKSQPTGSGCAASTNAQGYDGSGNILFQRDFNSALTCFSYQSNRNVESSRVEGLPASFSCPGVIIPGSALPMGSRKISTEWHSDWQLVKRAAGPGVITSDVYNGQPDPFNSGAVAVCAPATALLPDGKPIAVLCRRVEQATSDTDGSLGFAAPLTAVATREQRWTYNQDGQVLTHDGPRTDVADVTYYAYYSDTTADHTRGDLQALTNSAGHVSNYLRYNAAGQVLTMVDPNGVTTTNTYDLRQRLTSITVGGLTTIYGYDLAGQLVRVTSPDGAYTGYAYDAAHRLAAVFDNLGNRIDYMLDAAGKRMAERVNDESGMLRRQLSRSFDALGRPQRITGRE